MKKGIQQKKQTKTQEIKKQKQVFQIYYIMVYLVKMFLWMFASIKETNKKWNGEN